MSKLPQIYPDKPPNHDWIKHAGRRAARKKLEAGPTPAPAPSQGEPGDTDKKRRP